MIKYFVFILFIVQSLGLFSQKRIELENTRKQKLEEIAKVENLLKKTENDKEITSKRIVLLNQKIKLRYELIADLGDEISLLDGNIVNLNSNINKRNIEIESLKSEYAKVLYSSYYHFRSFNLLLFIAASNSFNQAYRRFTYLKQFTIHRKNLLLDISKEVKGLEIHVTELTNLKEKKTTLINLKESEASSLESDKVQQNQSVNLLASEEKKLKKQLNELQEAAKKIEKEIERIIREEVIAKAKRSKKVIKEELQLTSDFGGNKGKLPWPVKGGTVVSYFGIHEHPIYKGIKIKDDGITISSGCNIDVFSVFDGVVSRIFGIKGANLAIIIRHGDYLTVYSNIQNLSVNIGEKVKANQVIGKSYCTNNENISNVQFGVWHELNKLNPMDWLKR
jgi:septal ring factor EnvC (AmiA/AmiB activator)